MQTFDPQQDQLSPGRLKLLRAGYALTGLGLVVVKWPLLLDVRNEALKTGTVDCMLIALSVFALVGLRHPVRMLPILLFEVAWKLTWLAAVALPLWLTGDLGPAHRDQLATILWIALVLPTIPWRFALSTTRPRATSPAH
jgi:hypothetical protein